MQSRYIDGVDVPSYDETLTEALMEDLACDEGGAQKRLGIENDKKVVYRVFTMHGQSELDAALEELALMDFTAVLHASHNSSSTADYDIRLRPPGDR
ncbi:hypothetical protein [Salinicola endophyticus]|uniref:Uncharacterized protein n=1 Tax=Salinicola endophyticus TaxID=1949083 RepID=A0AB74UIA9_9GAMM